VRPSVPLALLALLAPGLTRGQECADGGSPEVAQRIAALRGRLEAERGPARAWSVTFGIVNGALIVGQLVAAARTHDHGQRGLLLAGAATSAGGLAQIVFAPITPSDADLAPGGDPCTELARLERAYEHRGRNERLGTGVGAHVGNFVINAGFGIAAGLLARRPGPGLVTFAVGFGLGEAQILTEPRGLTRPLEFGTGSPAGPSGPGAARGARGAWPGGVGIAIRFEF
jgi:hypothetical protein